MNKRPVDKNATEQIASRRKGFNMASTFQAMDKGTEFIFADNQAMRYIKTGETTYESASLQIPYGLKPGRENANVFLKDPEPRTSTKKKHQDPDILNLHCPECDKEMVFVGMGFTEYWCEACGTSYDIKTKEFEDQGRHKKDPLANSHGVYMRTEDVIVPFKKASGYKAKIAIATTSKGDFVMATSQQKTFGNISGSSSGPSIYDKRYGTRDEALMAGAKEVLERIKRNLKARDGICTEATNKAKMTSALADIESYISKIKPAAELAKAKPSMPDSKKKKETHLAAKTQTPMPDGKKTGKKGGLSELLGKPKKGLFALLDDQQNSTEANTKPSMQPGERKLEITTHKTIGSTYELKVLSLLKSLKDQPTLNMFESVFNREIESIKRTSTSVASISYRLRWVGDQYVDPNAYLELWHRSSPERKVATIKKAAIKVPEIITLPQKGLFDHLLFSVITETKTTMLERKKPAKKSTAPAKPDTSYPGGKGSAGTAQKIINKFPPHTRYAELCLGSGKILNAKKPAAENYGVEINESTIAKFTYPAGATIVHQDAVTWIKENWNILTPETLVYVDPPYPIESRLSQLPLYDFEMTDQQHIDLLELLLSMPAMVAISTYKNDLYAQMLKGWTVYTFESNTRQGMATEYLYMNYPDPVKLHEYTYLGKDFTDRQRIKRKIEGHVSKLKALPPLERHAIIQALQSL
jgi:DNA adenine methylase